MRIYFSGGDRRMTEQALDKACVDSLLYQKRCSGMPKHMRRYPP